MKRFKEMATIFSFLHCWLRGSRRLLWQRRVVIVRGILIFRVHGFFAKLQPPDSLQLPPPPGEYCWH
ncbi:Uncharacterised protein [Salmonella enterica subsp. enterica serovar Daytona]|uniref:Uncharacterized protein n=1 Tax=Salmonella enterica subsp. enterica serovar Daytona TaxID=1962639 RepID=A0A447JH87_SALET|nr:Uncharacterised protein [Salmonella enterica subsp. enterica serovar Daytona]